MEEDKRFQRAFKDAAIGISLLAVEPLGKYLEVNPSFCQMTGYSREELLARDFQSITASQDLDQNLQQVHTLLSGIIPSLQLEKRYIRKDGSSFWARLHVSLVRDSQGKPLYFTVQIEDIDERKRAEEAQKVSISLLQATLDSTADGILVVDRVGKIVSFNQQFAHMWRIPDEVLSTRDNDRALAWVMDQLKQPEQFLERVKELMSQPEGESFDVIEFKDGRVFERFTRPQRIEGRPVGRVVSFRDVTERRRLEEQLRHAQKLEAIGQLAGGVAHEFNNLLTAIIGNLNLATKQTPQGTDLQSILTRAEQTAHRAAMLTQQLLTFSRRSPIDLQPQDLHLITEEVAHLLRQTIDRQIEMTVESVNGLWPVLADADQMKQVIMNLCVNARDALVDRLAKDPDHKTPLSCQPLIAVKTENVHVDESFCRLHPDAKPGDSVCLSVFDNGCGIDEDTQCRLFEPFFTTKEVGRGTGLGLATVYGIIKQHEGWIELNSAKNEATTFKIYLPRTQRPAVRMAQRTMGEVVAGGTETILFVDDETPIRRLGQTVLEHHGYTVLLAKDGVEALEIFRRERERIRLIVLDLTMPRQSGREVLKQLRMLNPKVKVIVSSGHHMASSVNELQDPGTVEFVPKPYRPDELARSVRKLLDQIDHS